MKFKIKRAWVLSATFLFTFTLVYAARSTWYRRDVVSGSMIHLLENDGTTTQKNAAQFGSDEDSPSLPTTSNANNFGVKVPFYNSSGGTLSAGMVVISSYSAGTAFYGSITTALSTSTVIGINDASCSNAAVCYMSVGGYALVLTSGPVYLGSVLVTTNTAAGYAGALLNITTNTATGSSANPIVGSIIGTAVSNGTAAGGLTAVKLR